MSKSDSRLSDSQRAERFKDALTHIQDNVRCLETRKFIARVLREVDGDGIAPSKSIEKRPVS